MNLVAIQEVQNWYRVNGGLTNWAGNRVVVNR